MNTQTTDGAHNGRMAGPVPAGVWVLDLKHSSTLVPKSMTLWIINNSGGELMWVAVESYPDQSTKVCSWNGRYGGPPEMVLGAGIEARLTCQPEDGIRTEGEFPGLGPFVEVCTVVDGGKRMICEGRVTTSTGTQKYVEHFDWFGESPHQPMRSKP